MSAIAEFASLIAVDVGFKDELRRCLKADGNPATSRRLQSTVRLAPEHQPGVKIRQRYEWYRTFLCRWNRRHQARCARLNELTDLPGYDTDGADAIISERE